MKIVNVLAVVLLAGCVGDPPERQNIISSATELNPTITPPENCPDFSKLSIEDYDNGIGSNYGCSTVTNLGVMIADPNDLIMGKSSDLYDAARSSVSVGNYESGPLGGGAIPTATPSR